MRVEDLKRYISTLKDDDDLLVSFISRKDFCDTYNAGEPIPDWQWNRLEDSIGFNAEDIEDVFEYIKFKGENENSW